MKKRIISVLLVLIAIFYLCPTTAFAASLGDVSGDGQLNAQDSFYLRSYLAGKIDLEPDALAAADMNRDGSVTAADSFMLKRNIIGVQDTGYRLIVNDKDITKSSYEFYLLSGWVEVPLLAVCEAMGAKVTYRTDSIVDIAFDQIPIPGIEYYRENYVLFLDEQRLVEAEYEGVDYNLIKPVPGGTMRCRVHDGDIVLDLNTFRGLYLFDNLDYHLDYTFKVDYQNKTIYFWGEM